MNLYITHLLIPLFILLCKQTIMVRIVLNLEVIPGTLGMKWGYTLYGSPAHGRP